MKNLFYIESDAEFGEQDAIDELIENCKVEYSGEMWSILKVQDGVDIDELIENIKVTSESEGTEHAQPVYLCGLLSDKEVAERIYEHMLRREDTLYILDDEGANMYDATVRFFGKFAAYQDSVDGYSIMFADAARNFNLVKDLEE